MNGQQIRTQKGPYQNQASTQQYSNYQNFDRELVHGSRSSGLGALPVTNNFYEEFDVESRERMLRGSIGSGENLDKSAEDLTLDMLGPSGLPRSHNHDQQNISDDVILGDGEDQDLIRRDDNKYTTFLPQMTSKNPPSSALDLHRGVKNQTNQRGNLESYGDLVTLEQYQQNNAQLHSILKQLDSTPQFNHQLLQKTAQNQQPSAGQQVRNLEKINESLQEVSQFRYTPDDFSQGNHVQYQQTDSMFAQNEFAKMELLQQVIQNKNQNFRNQNQQLVPNQKQLSNPLQNAGKQMIRQQNNENSNNLNHLQIEKSKSQPNRPKVPIAPVQVELQHQYQAVMQNFDDIPISKIKNMVGYQTNPDMYNSDAKNKESQSQLPPVIEQPAPKQSNDSEEDDDESYKTLEERVISRQWKVRMEAFKQINQHFYNDYARAQGDQNHHQSSFQVYGPLLQEMIKDTNLTNAYEALQALYSYVRFAADIKNVTFACHIFLLEKVQTFKPNFKDITLKILITMIRRDQSVTIYPEITKRFKSQNSKVALFAMQAAIEAFKTNEAAPDMNLKYMFKCIQDSLIHKNNELRDAAYKILKSIYERCREDAAEFTQNCSKLRPIQTKELMEVLSKTEKINGSNFSLFENTDMTEERVGSKTQKHEKAKEIIEQHEIDEDVQIAVKPVEQEYVDILTLVPADFSEIPYTTQINTKKKSMETFNNELIKLVERANVIVKTKDFTNILNTVQHMLEDKNMLVFLEAIKTVELLAVLIGPKLQKQLKAFINVIAGKYGETKTAVIAAVDKTLGAIVKYALTPTVFSDVCLNQIAVTHKNPRVKQLIIEHTMGQFVKTLDSDQAQSVFKVTKEKLVQLILKDTHNSVRDAAVALLIQFKQLLTSDVTQPSVTEAINQLPKFRIQEINKKLETSAPQGNPDYSKTMIQATELEVKPIKGVADEFSKTIQPLRSLPAETPDPSLLGSILLAVKEFTAGNFKGDPHALSAQWQEKLSKMDQKAILKNRPQVMHCINELLQKNPPLLYKNLIHLRALLTVTRQMLSAEQSLCRDQNGQSQELFDFLQITVLQTQFLANSQEKNAGEMSQMLLIGMIATNDVTEFCEVLRDVVELPAIMSSKAAIQIISNVYVWMGSKLQEFLHMGMQMDEVEQLRGFGIRYLENTTLFDEKQRQNLIQIMVRFKDQVTQLKGSLAKAQQTVSFTEPATIQEPEEAEITGELICKTIDSEFENGLLLFKKLAQQCQGELAFETKEMIFKKLIGIMSESQQKGNQQQQQYKQAYALKALMWMKEETMGVDDSFQLLRYVLSAYASQILQQVDASVEEYLLNFWVKDLSIRDVCDRIQLIIQGSDHPARLDADKTEGFCVMMTWFSQTILMPKPDLWKLSDLRKITYLLSLTTVDTQSKECNISRQLLDFCVEREGRDKVLQVIEIQLLQANEVLMQFVDWFNVAYPEKKKAAAKKYEESKVPPMEIQRVRKVSQDQEEFGSRKDDNLTERSNADKQSYNQRRQQMKESHARTVVAEIEQSSQQVQEIIQRLESAASRQQESRSGRPSQHVEDHSHITVMNQEPTQTQLDMERPFRKTNTSSYYKSIEKPRYNEDDQNEEDNNNQINQSKENFQAKHQQEAIRQRVQQSEAKQQVWMSKISELEKEKERIEQETEELKRQKNEESHVWQNKLKSMQKEHSTVTANLSQVNQCYLQQVDENENLKSQLAQMQKQHSEMISRFEQIERRINSREQEERQAAVQTPNKVANSRPDLVISVQKIQRISDTFGEREFGNTKIQELLLAVEKNVDGELAQPLIAHYIQMRHLDQRIAMIASLSEALSENEDVLLCLSVDVYKAVLNFLLRAFAHEKERLERSSIGGYGQRNDQNEVTLESQKMVSRLINSKDFTTSLVQLFQLLKEAMPSNLMENLTAEQRHYLRVIMRCIQRITKALHSEAQELFRAFDVLVEMQKIFIKNPPENLREELPCLQDFDDVYRGMKDVSDKLIELQPEKVQSFLTFTENGPENAFIKYLKQMTR